MRTTLAAITLAAGLIAVSSAALPHAATDTTLERMPTALETRYALSALPSTMRDAASVYLLDPAKGYSLARKGTSGVTCLVERTAWEQSDYRNDIYVPLCYDAVGTATYLKVIMDAAALRSQGTVAAALKTTFEQRYRNKTYAAPTRPGVSYMVAPVMRTWMMPDWNVHTAPMPHLMFYAPNITAGDIGAVPTSGMMYPIAFREGPPEQSYMVQILGEAERTRIATDEKDLLEALCAYRTTLCLSPQ